MPTLPPPSPPRPVTSIMQEAKDNSSLSAKARTEKQLRYDELKQKFCMEHEIALEQIKYTGSSYEKLEDLITNLLVKYGFAGDSDDLPF